MSLFQQLMAIISLLVILIFGGTLFQSINSKREYISSQLASVAKETAKSISLSIKPFVVKHDYSAIDATVNAMFDPGYFEELVISEADGNILLERKTEIKIINVPAWFVNLIPLETPRQSSIITGGWEKFGTVTIKMHPGYAYAELWQDLKGKIIWYLAAYALSLLAGAIGLRIILKSLKAVEKQALAIAEREFPVLDILPWTKEFRSVVTAMNIMSTKTKKMIEEYTELANRLRNDAFIDPTSGLGNKRSFDMHIGQISTKKKESENIALIKIRLNEFANFNHRFGWKKGDELIRQLAEIIIDLTRNDPNIHLSRVGGGEFVILATELLPAETIKLGTKLNEKLKTIQLDDGIYDIATIGATYVPDGRYIETLTSDVDEALELARHKGGVNAVHYYSSLAPKEQDNDEGWREIIRNVISTSNILLMYQPVRPIDDGTGLLHLEVLARMHSDSNKHIPASHFIPMVERLKYTLELDIILIQKLLKIVSSGGESSNIKYALNIFSSSALNPRFIDAISADLTKYQSAAKHIIFEIPEKGAILDLDKLNNFITFAHNFGCEVSLDDVGLGSHSFAYLHDVKIDYIKIHGGYARDLKQHIDNQYVIQAISDIAHSLDMTVIGKTVETLSDIQELQKLNVDAAMGYLYGKPVEKYIPEAL